MNYPQIMSPCPLCLKKWGHVPPAPMGAPPMTRTTPPTDWVCHIGTITLRVEAVVVNEGVSPSTPDVPNCCCSKGPAPY